MFNAITLEAGDIGVWYSSVNVIEFWICFLFNEALIKQSPQTCFMQNRQDSKGEIKTIGKC